MTDRLKEIEARASAATEGPWSHDGDGVHQLFRGHLPNELFKHGNFSTPADGEFVSAAREDVPWLLDQVRQLSARLAEAEGLLREYTERRGFESFNVVDKKIHDYVAAFLAGKGGRQVTKETDRELVDRLLNDARFRKVAEADIGPVRRVVVDWENNNVTFYGLRGNRQIDLQAMLATLRGQIQ